jgi:dihydroxy-acid dehydratase
MDVEESIRGNPLDGVVLLMGCDKTTPSLMMGAASVDLPTIGVSGGPMLSGWYRGQRTGSGTNVWQLSEELRAGHITLADFHEAETCTNRSHGHCMTMGTASTMASMVEALGFGLPGNATFPAVDARRNVIARMAGRRIVGMVNEDLTMSKILTREAFENAIRVNAAIGGSTNAVIHLIAIARRIGVKLNLDDWDELGRGIHTLLDLQPNGKYLMEDFCYAGGLPVVLRELGENNLLHKNALTVNGRTMWENVKEAPCWNRDVIHSYKKPFKRDTGL